MALGYTQQELRDLFVERFATYAHDPHAQVVSAELQLGKDTGRTVDDPHLFAQIVAQALIDMIDVNNKKIAAQLGNMLIRLTPNRPKSLDAPCPIVLSRLALVRLSIRDTVFRNRKARIAE